MLIIKRFKIDREVGHRKRGGQGHGANREETDEQQAVVWLPTPSVYFHITSINHSGKEPVREMEREKIDPLMCLVLTPRPETSF